MCAECRCNPCDSRCPNADEVIIAECAVCGDILYAGDTAYKIDGGFICESCMDDNKCVLEVSDAK